MIDVNMLRCSVVCVKHFGHGLELNSTSQLLAVPFL